MWGLRAPAPALCRRQKDLFPFSLSARLSTGAQLLREESRELRWPSSLASSSAEPVIQLTAEQRVVQELASGWNTAAVCLHAPTMGAREQSDLGPTAKIASHAQVLSDLHVQLGAYLHMQLGMRQFWPPLWKGWRFCHIGSNTSELSTTTRKAWLLRCLERLSTLHGRYHRRCRMKISKLRERLSRQMKKLFSRLEGSMLASWEPERRTLTPSNFATLMRWGRSSKTINRARVMHPAS
jgi:hypothetical protein